MRKSVRFTSSNLVPQGEERMGGWVGGWMLQAGWGGMGWTRLQTERGVRGNNPHISPKVGHHIRGQWRANVYCLELQPGAKILGRGSQQERCCPHMRKLCCGSAKDTDKFWGIWQQCVRMLALW